jgi:CubicO group peptidase (beta-lactamase class C family)
LLALAVVAQGAATPARAPEEIITSIFKPATGTPQRPSAIVAFRADGKEGILGFGMKSLPSGAPPDANTVYEIGSITKGLTGILLADMANAGEVSLHDTLDKYLREPSRFPEAIRTITLLQLATHSSGLPRLPANLMFGMKDAANPYAHYGREQLETFLQAYAPPPGRTTITPEYSNLGFGLLGFLLADRAVKPYGVLLKERVLDPLGMRDTTIALSPDQQKRLAPGHAQGKPAANWDLDALAGAGAVRSTAADMTKLLQALMNPPGGRIGKAIKLATEPRASLGAARIGLGWLTTTQPSGLTMTWHNGGTGGYRTFIAFTPNGRHGIVVLTNTADQSPDPLGATALTLLAGRTGLTPSQASTPALWRASAPQAPARLRSRP